jgi:hypothetical protein
MLDLGRDMQQHHEEIARAHAGAALRLQENWSNRDTRHDSPVPAVGWAENKLALNSRSHSDWPSFVTRLPPADDAQPEKCRQFCSLFAR